MRRYGVIAAAVGFLLVGGVARAKVIDPGMHHLRSGAKREWDEFPEKAEGAERVVRFQGRATAAGQTLRLRQRDVKQPWVVKLNGQKVASLTVDENDMVGFWEVRGGILRDGENELRVACEAGAAGDSDDVMVGGAELIQKAPAEVLGEARVEVEVVDGDGGGPTPCRVTIVDENGSLMTTGVQSAGDRAARSGVLYLRDGWAMVGVSAGKYTLYAGRGFEYSLATEKVDLKAGDAVRRRMEIRRVVPTDGYVSCDTHVHTLTHSHHGDATAEERMITLAGEGIELPVATEHNLQVDYTAAAEATGTRRFFTPVTGNEITTAALGHFNVFPLSAKGKVIDWRPRDWPALGRSIAEVAPGAVVILNHARDTHGGFAPFDPRRHISVAGEPLDGVFPPANAMEVINSGATRADPLELFRDYFGLLNRGVRLTPIGASDSHDVARYIVGQSRTYIDYSPHPDPSQIDTPRATRALHAGRVTVSYGLLTTLTLSGHFTPGDLAPLPPNSSDPLAVDVTVLGPEWTTASRVAIYVNGVETAQTAVPASTASSPGVKFQHRFSLPRPKHDVHLVALATGPGVTAPYWPCAKPYQPTSPRYTPYVLGATAPVFIDADHNGRFDSAHDYADRLVAETIADPADPASLSARLADYDETVSVQAASALRARDPQHFEPTCRRLIDAGPPHVKRGIRAYLNEWQATTMQNGPATGAK